MAEKKNKDRNPFLPMADAFVEDILKASDEDVLAEFQETEGKPTLNAQMMRAKFEKIVLSSNKSRLMAAKAGAASESRAKPPHNAVIDIAEARRRLKTLSRSQPNSGKLTLAARNETEMSDEDVLSMYEDLVELGVIVDSDDKNK